MRIVVDLQACQSLPHRERGIGRYAMAFTKALLRNASDNDDDVWVALNGEIDGTVEPIRGALTGSINENRIVVWRSLRGTAASNPSNQWRAAAASLVRSEFIAQLKPDMVHVSSLFEGYIDDVTCAVEPGRSYATSVSLYDLIPFEMPDTYLTDPRLRNWYMGRIEQLKSVDLILGISDYTCRQATDLLQIPSERTVPVMAGVEPLFSPRAIGGDAALQLLTRFGIVRPFVMFTGGLDPRKNIEGLIAAYSSLEPTLRAQHQLVIVCDTPTDQVERLQMLATQCGLQSGDLILTSYVSDADLVALYNLCHVFIFPSLNEGFGFPPLEAMACGAAVIGSNTSSIPEVIGDADALFDPRDQTSISEKLQQVLTSEVLRDRLRRRATERAAEFTWDRCAKRALAAMHESSACVCTRKIDVAAGKSRSKKPLLAYVSPVPPVRSGIADYSAELLPALAEHYRVEVVTDQEQVTDEWISEHALIRSYEWFDAHADRYDQIVYQVGNSAAHARMPALLERHPGVLVLHELHLGGLVSHLELASKVPGYWTRGLYESHGYAALVERVAAGDPEPILQRYPCTLSLIRDADGVIVHNQHCRDLAGRWFGPDISQDWITLPHLRVVPEKLNRGTARRALGLGKDEFLVCCFGILGPLKCDREILEAWFASSLHADSCNRLVFVGGAHDPAYAQELEQFIDLHGASSRPQITGWVDPALYHEYLAAADLAVQLRTSSRGETSGTVLDCLAFGVPTIVNAHASLAELPAETVEMVPDEFTREELAAALGHLRVDQARREDLAKRGPAYCRRELDPATVAERYRDAIERLRAGSPHRGLADLALAIASIDGAPPDLDVNHLAAGIAANRRPVGEVRQLLIDVSELVRRDVRSGIQRVVRSILNVLLRQPPAGFRVEPVYANPNTRYRYARAFTARFLGLGEMPLPPDDPIDIDRGDVFLGLDLAPAEIPANVAEIGAMRDRGVKTYFVVYDQLPLRRPDCFGPNAYEVFTKWMRAVASVGDGLVAISKAVETEVRETLDTLQIDRARPLDLGYFHLGADLEASEPDRGIDPEQERCIERLGNEPAFLVVGTIEPRKGHAQTLDAFELLWERGSTVSLILVGKPGWMTESLVARLRDHAENGRRLIWFELASDELLVRLYETSAALLAPSEGEGFGLPLIEAAQRGLPILCRDLPVFREIAGDYACYFAGDDGRSLASAIEAWLERFRVGSLPDSKAIPRLTWSEATAQLLSVILDHHWDGKWVAQQRNRPERPSRMDAGSECQGLSKITGKFPQKGGVSIAKVRIETGEPSGSVFGGRGERRILVDISEIVRLNTRSGIQRVTQRFFRGLMSIARETGAFEVEPFCWAEGEVHYARKFARDRLGMACDGPDDAVQVKPCDLAFMLDSSWWSPERFDGLHTRIRQADGEVVWMVHDLIPIRFPQLCDPGMPPAFAAWLSHAVKTADGFVCNSEATRNDLAFFIDGELPAGSRRPWSQSIHLGCDLDSGMAPLLSETGTMLRMAVGKLAYFMALGTIEPRKDYKTILDAFELLWARGFEFALVIVGKQGWNVDALVERINEHPENGRRLFWIQEASDGDVRYLLEGTTALIQASIWEGFGLPLVEAGALGVPLIVSDIAVFHEVAGNGATYFPVGDAAALAHIAAQVAEQRTVVATPPVGRPRSWRDASEELAAVLSQRRRFLGAAWGAAEV